MKKITSLRAQRSDLLLIALFLFTTFTCSHAQLPKDTSFVNDYYAGSSVDTNNVLRSAVPTPFATRFVIIQNQSSTATDTLWFWFNNDSVTFKAYLLPGQRFQKTMLLKSINTRSGSANSIRRPIFVKGQ